MKRKVMNYGVAIGTVVIAFLLASKPSANSILSEREMAAIKGGQTPAVHQGKYCKSGSGGQCPEVACEYIGNGGSQKKVRLTNMTFPVCVEAQNQNSQCLYEYMVCGVQFIYHANIDCVGEFTTKDVYTKSCLDPQ